MQDRRIHLRKLTAAAMCVALGVLLPVAFHAIGAGPVFLPMHIPVLLCGFICGGVYGAVCGAVVPALSSLITGMPPVFPTALAMVFELAAYGLAAGLLYRRANVFVSLVGAMIIGRAVSGIANAIILGFAGREYGFGAFLSASFLTCWPGIAIQVVVIPLLVKAIERLGLAAEAKAA